MHALPLTPEQQQLIDELERFGIQRYDEDLPLYKYVTIETAKLILGNCTIKFSTPTELDDNDLEMDLLNANASEYHKTETAKELVKEKIAGDSCTTAPLQYRRDD